jgi:hypothetical protein
MYDESCTLDKRGTGTSYLLKGEKGLFFSPIVIMTYLLINKLMQGQIKSTKEKKNKTIMKASRNFQASFVCVMLTQK